jgi:hypothetical protein
VKTQCGGTTDTVCECDRGYYKVGTYCNK